MYSTQRDAWCVVFNGMRGPCTAARYTGDADEKFNDPCFIYVQTNNL